MPKYVALLRGINLGRRRVKMEVLRRLFEELKFANVSTFIASGNVLFESPSASEKKIRLQIETHLEEGLGYSVDTFLRTGKELQSLVSGKKLESMDADNTVHVAFLNEKLSPSVAKKLASCKTEIDELRISGREIIWLCRTRITESEVWNLPEVKH